MRNIFVFIARYSTFFLFLILQVVALGMLFRYNRFHEAAYMNIAHEVTGEMYIRYNAIETYFNLKEENELLREQNARLLNQLKADFEGPDTTWQLGLPGSDSLSAPRKFLYMPAKVIGNSVHAQNNYITLHRGSAQGVQPNMAVIGPNGIIGKVVDVSPNMSIVMSLLHRKNSVVALLKKGGGFGEITWDGRRPELVELNNIPRTIKVVKGDTVVTSAYSDIFPPGAVVGYVDEIIEDKSSSTYSLRVRTATDFYRVQHAYIVRNLQRGEMDSLLIKIRKTDE
jgi:rod shape-determining protein MreC